MLKKLVQLLPKNEIADECHDGKGLLMTRYYLSPKIFGVRFVLHQFHRSDNDRHYHDHPWNFISLILKGGYIEHFSLHNVPFQKVVRPGDIIHRKKEWKHWVELQHLPHIDGYDIYIVPQYEECWTLVLFYGQRRDWGFWTESGWVKHDKYDCRGQYGKDRLQPTKTSNT